MGVCVVLHVNVRTENGRECMEPGLHTSDTSMACVCTVIFMFCL